MKDAGRYHQLATDQNEHHALLLGVRWEGALKHADRRVNVDSILQPVLWIACFFTACTATASFTALDKEKRDKMVTVQRNDGTLEERKP